MKKIIGYFVKITLLVLFIVCVYFLNPQKPYNDIFQIYNKNYSIFENISQKMCEYPYENYSIDKRNLSSLEEFFLKNDQSFLDDINQIFEMGFKSITKSGSAIFFYYDNFLNFYGSKAYGVAYFQYYYSTNEQKYELITSIKEIKEKNQHWYYYEQR